MFEFGCLYCLLLCWLVGGFVGCLCGLVGVFVV